MNASPFNLTPQQLRRAADIKERIDALQDELARLFASPNVAASQRRRPKTMVAAAHVKATNKGKRRMSAAQRTKLSAIASARWKKAKAQGKNAL